MGSGMGRVLPLLMIIMLLSSHGALGSSTRTGSNLGTASNSNTGNNRTYSNNLVLNVSLNDAAKALVAGYADSINGLSFLKTSQYSYDQDTKQLYVPTNSLTYKQGDNWVAKLLSDGSYGEYHCTFYMPSLVSVSNISFSRAEIPGLGLQCLLRGGPPRLRRDKSRRHHRLSGDPRRQDTHPPESQGTGYLLTRPGPGTYHRCRRCSPSGQGQKKDGASGARGRPWGAIEGSLHWT